MIQKPENHVITLPDPALDLSKIHVGDRLLISGKIFCGRDAVLPKIVALIKEGKLEEKGLDLKGTLIFHTAVSRAGVGPTSSNKLEIEGSFPALSEAGVKIHLGKGAIKKETIAELDRCGSLYAVIPPVTALLESKTKSRKVVAFEELGMEAFYELEVEEYPAIVAAVHNQSIYES